MTAPEVPEERKVGEYLLEWLEATRVRLRPSTYIGYGTNIRCHIIPAIGGLELDEVKPTLLNKLYAELLRSGRVDGKGGLSKRTVNYTHTILRRALRDAVSWGLIERDPTAGVVTPSRRPPEMATWTSEELRTFLRYVENDRYYPAWLLAATTGLRRGELLGLKWRDVDLVSRRLRIRQTYVAVGNLAYWSEPKTKTSRRQVIIPGGAAEVLRRWEVVQAAEMGEWAEGSPGAGVVFTQPNGEPVHPDRFTRRFARLIKEAGLPHIRLHDLRHTFATLALEAGIHVKVVSEMLGHSSITITLDTYSHVLPAMHEEAIEQISDVIFGG